MDQRLTFLTLGVNDLQAMKNFYVDKFGWKVMKEMGDIVFFKLNSCILALYPAQALADDIGIPENGKGFKRFTLAINYPSQHAVDSAFDVLQKRDVTIIKSPTSVPWGGYSGYIADVEENYWEIAYNPFLSLDKLGNVTGHD